jgi:hypothetical protein
MSKSIRISDELAESAEKAAAASHRSPPQQIEHWAQIGRILEPAPSYSAMGMGEPAGRSELEAVLTQAGSPEGTECAQAMIRRTSGDIVSID